MKHKETEVTDLDEQTVAELLNEIRAPEDQTAEIGTTDPEGLTPSNGGSR